MGHIEMAWYLEYVLPFIDQVAAGAALISSVNRRSGHEVAPRQMGRAEFLAIGIWPKQS
jgi:hypothetical protein